MQFFIHGFCFCESLVTAVDIESRRRNCSSSAAADEKCKRESRSRASGISETMSISPPELSPDLGELFEFDEIESEGNSSYNANRCEDDDLSEGVPLSVELSESLCRSAAEAVLSGFVRAPEIFLRIDNESTTTSCDDRKTPLDHGGSVDSNGSDASFVAIAGADAVELQYENEFVDTEISGHDSGHALRPSQFESDNEQLLYEGKQNIFSRISFPFCLTLLSGARSLHFTRRSVREISAFATRCRAKWTNEMILFISDRLNAFFSICFR